MAPMLLWTKVSGGSMSDKLSAIGKFTYRFSSTGALLCKSVNLTKLTCRPLYAISLFLPSIVAGLGYSGPTAQLLTVPVYVCACGVCILMAFFSDRSQRRGPFVGGL